MVQQPCPRYIGKPAFQSSSLSSPIRSAADSSKISRARAAPSPASARLSQKFGGKWLELIVKIRPGLRRVAGILDPDFRGFARVWSAVETLAPKLHLEARTLAFRKPADDIESAVAMFAQSGAAGLIVLPTALNNLHRARIIGAASRYRLPAIYPFALYARSGGLASYGIDTVDLFRRSASYVDRILKGEKPADLPVQAPTKYELVINMRTAKVLGIAIPESLQVQADELIQ